MYLRQWEVLVPQIIGTAGGLLPEPKSTWEKVREMAPERDTRSSGFSMDNLILPLGVVAGLGIVGLTAYLLLGKKKK